MFSLLPQQYKKNLKKEYNVRRIVLALGFVGLLAVICIILYVPFFILAQMEVSTLEERIVTLKTTAEDDSGKQLRQELNQITATVTLLNKDTASTNLTSLITTLINERQDAVRVTSMTYRDSDTHEFEIALAGIATNRDALRAFAKRLESQEVFSSVNLPVSNFAQEANIRFALTVYGHEK